MYSVCYLIVSVFCSRLIFFREYEGDRLKCLLYFYVFLVILVIGEKLNIMWICALTVAKLHLNVFKVVWYFAFFWFVFWYDDLLFLHSGQQFQWSHHTHKVQMSKQCPWSCHTQKFRWGNSYHAHIIHANLDEWTVSMVATHTQFNWTGTMVMSHTHRV